MTELRRKKRFRWKRVYSLLLSLLLLAAAACGFLLLRRAPEPREVHPAAEEAVLLFQAVPEDLVSVQIAPGTGEAYTLRISGSTLTLPEDPDFTLRPALNQLILDNCLTVRAETVYARISDGVPLSAFGLSPEAMSVRITCADGTEHRIRIGAQAASDIPYYYFLWDDDDRIFGGSIDMADAFSCDLAFLRAVPQPAIRADLLSAVRLEGEADYSFRCTDAGWQMLSPVNYPLNPDRMEGYLENLEGFAFSRYLGSAEGADLAAAGLSEPAMTLTLSFAPSVLTVPDTQGATHTFPVDAHEEVFLIGGRYDSQNRWALYRGGLYTVTDFRLSFLTAFDLSNSLLMYPVNFEPSALRALTVRTAEGRVRFELVLTEQTDKKGTLLTGEEGETLWDLHVTRDGEAFDSDAFLSLYNRLRRLAPEGTLTVPEGETLAWITLESAGFTRVVTLSRADAMHLALGIDGTCLFYCAESWLDVVRSFLTQNDSGPL